MAELEEMTVEIWRDGACVASCFGPGKAGQCPAHPSSTPPLCAGAELLVRSAPDDRWLFTVSSVARGCPLAWLVSETGPSTVEGLFSSRRTPWKQPKSAWR
jgi:hypothetical protein